MDGVDQSEMFLEGKESEREELVYNIDVEFTGAFFSVRLNHIHIPI